MSESQTRTPTRGRGLRRAFKFVAILTGIVVLVVVGGLAVVWGHFWDFRVGDPTSESCANCHTMEDYVDSLSDMGLLASRHANHDVGCIDCHEYGLDEQIQDTLAFLQDDYEQPFARMRFDNEQCFQCHEHGSYDQLAWRTTDLGVSDAQASWHDANPHQPPHYSDLECHSCHRMHRPSTLLCWECHTYEFRFPITPQ